MRKITVLITLLITSLYAFAQQRAYVLTCGDDTTKVVWSEQKIDTKIHLHITQGDETNRYILSESLRTEQWSVENKLKNTDFTIECRNNNYYITGILEGKDISKVVRSKGEVWFQNIAYNAIPSLKGKDAIEFECFRPDNLKLFVMEAEHNGISKTTTGADATKVNVHLTGFLSMFWNCNYLFDLDTGLFIEYSGIHGAPGTPETVIKLAQ